MVNPFDSAAYPDVEPGQIVVGKFIAWNRSIPGMTSADYSVRYDFVCVTHSSSQSHTHSVDATYNANIDRWVVEMGGGVTENWHAGGDNYRWDLVVVRNSDSEEAVVDTGFMLFFDSTDDRRTYAEIMVQKIESILSGRADSDVNSYTIKSRSISKMSVSELIEWRDYFKAEVRRTGGSTGSTDKKPKSNAVRVRFV